MGSVQFHPFRPYILTATGSRKRLESDPGDDSDSDASTISDSSDEDSVDLSDPPAEGEPSLRVGARHSQRPTSAGTSLRIWEFASVAP